MKTLTTFLTMVLICASVIAQDAKETIEGIRIHNGEIFITNDFKLNTNKDAIGFFDCNDNCVLLVPKHYKVYFEAFNPMNYSLNQMLEVKSDPVDEAITKLLNGVVLNLVPLDNKAVGESSKDMKPKQTSTTTNTNLLSEDAKRELDTIIEKLKSDTSIQCLTMTQTLIDLKFKRKDSTLIQLDALANQLGQIKNIYTDIEKRIQRLLIRIDIEKKNVKEPSLLDIGWSEYTLLQQILKDVQSACKEQQIRVNNFEKALNSVIATVKNWESVIYSGKWFFSIRQEEKNELERDVIHELTITFDTHLSSLEGESIKKGEVKTTKKTFRLKRFDRFIPEISAGTVYTWQSQSKYVTAVDASGNTIVSETKETTLDRFELDVMLNFNFYLPESRVLPFIQLGIATNGDIPMGLFGAGLRMKLNEKRVLGLAYGVSITGIKELSNLSLGDQVLDERTLQNDLQYTLSPFKPYIGIQYNF